MIYILTKRQGLLRIEAIQAGGIWADSMGTIRYNQVIIAQAGNMEQGNKVVEEIFNKAGLVSPADCFYRMPEEK
ncbi:MAG: hypothetical protein AB9883_07935 [Acidaminococcaceae bacterium]